MKTGLLDILVFSALFVLAAKNAASQSGRLQITSPAFGHNQTIPKKYTCQGEDINPPLKITGVPSGTISLALIMDDPDAPMGTWVHWTVWNIPPVTQSISENVGTIAVEGMWSEGLTSFGRSGYGGPCPPSGTHRYFFKLYAIDTTLTLPSTASKKALEKAIEGHVLDEAQLIGLYQKQ